VKPQIHAAIDPGANPPTVGIVGGLGRMGRWFAGFFEGAGFPVLISDLHTELSSEHLARKCQVLILSLPMEVFPKEVAKLGPLVPESSFMTDLCSLKQSQVACMLEHARCEVVRWFTWWEGLLQQHGAVTSVVSPEEHDRTMAWAQALNHFILLCLGKALDEHGMDLQQIMALAPPSFERQMDIVARFYHQDPELYATIQMSNPYTNNILETFSQYGENLRKIIKERDRSAFIELFEEVQDLGRTILLLKKDK
jgi:prephenate dehydrogenase